MCSRSKSIGSCSRPVCQSRYAPPRPGRCQLRDRATQVALLGSAAPEIEVADWVLGQPTTLAEQHGKVLLLEFWVRWCRPCLAMFPVLRELHSRYAECGLTIAALTRYVLSPRGDPIADRVRQRDAICQTIAGRGLEIAVGTHPIGGCSKSMAPRESRPSRWSITRASFDPPRRWPTKRSWERPSPIFCIPRCDRALSVMSCRTRSCS